MPMQHFKIEFDIDNFWKQDYL